MTNKQKEILIEVIDGWFKNAQTDPEMWCYAYEPDDNGSIEASFVELFTDDIIEGKLDSDDFGELLNDAIKLKELKEFIKKYIYDSDKISVARKAWTGELDYSEYGEMMDELDEEE